MLTPQEADTLFVDAGEARGRRCGLLYITHRLEEVRRLCDRATVLRAGKVVAACDPRVESVARLASLMVGSEVVEVRAAPLHAARARALRHGRPELPPPELHGVALRDVSLAVRGGEIVGIAGVAGNGQSELFAAMSGEMRGRARRRGAHRRRPVGREGIDARRRRNAAFVPEERNGHAAAPSLTLSRKRRPVAPRHRWRGQRGLVDRRGGAQGGRRDHRRPSTCARAGRDPPARHALRRQSAEIRGRAARSCASPACSIVNQPTWGVDAGAAATIRQALIDLAARGAAVIVISQDLDEIFAISDRIAVIHDGTAVGRLIPRGRSTGSGSAS